MRKSRTLRCCVPRTYSIEQKKTQWRGTKLLVIVFVGPTTLEQKNVWRWRAELLVIVAMGTFCIWIKKNMMSLLSLCPKDLQCWNKKNDDEELNSLLSCAWLNCNIKIKEHDNKELNSLLSWPRGPLALEQKKTWRWGVEFFIVVSWNL